MSRRIKLVLMAASGVVIMLLSMVINDLMDASIASLASKASARIEKRADQARQLVTDVLAASPQSVFESHSVFQSRGIALYKFRNDSLLAWNNVQLPFRKNLSVFSDSSGATELDFGHCYYVKRAAGADAALALILLKPTHDLQNRYLSNQFVSWLRLPADVRVGSKGHPVVVKGKTLFHLNGSETEYSTTALDDRCFTIFLAGLILLLGASLMMMRDGEWRTALVIATIVLLTRIMMAAMQLPAFFYSSTLFDVRIFGNARSFLNGYLGDILVNATLILYAAALCRFFPRQTNQSGKIIHVVFSIAVLLVAAFTLNGCISSVVTNSTLNFNFLDFMNLSSPVFVALGALAVICIAVFLLLRVIAGATTKFSPPALYFFAPLLIFSALEWGLRDALSSAEIFWLPAAGLVVFACYRSPRIGPATGLALFLLVMSAFTSAIMSNYILFNESRDLEVLTLKLGERQDPVLENEFAGMMPAVLRDPQLQNLERLLPASAEAVRDLLNTRYLSGYFKRYTIEYSLFDPQCDPLLSPNDPLLLNEGYFTDQLKLKSDSVAPGLYFVRDYRRNSRYIGIIPLGEFRLYLLMEPKQFEELGSFPDLLLDESQQRHEKLTGFSYAVYRAGQNTSTYGSLNYPPFLPDSVALATAESDQVHWFFESDDYTKIIVSRPVRTWPYFFTFNSYMLLFFSIVAYVLFITYSLIFTSIFSRSSLTRRIQTIIIALLLLAMSAVGYTSASLIRSQFTSENTKELREKTEIIFTDLSRVFSPSQLFEPVNREAVNTRLNEYSRLFNTDVSLFDANGFLYATSQPRLYSLGLSARFAHPEAILRLSRNQAAAVTMSEQAGNLAYTSLYTALYNPGTSKPAGYINLPYFARQNDLVAELSGIVNGLVNVYVILFVISIFAGLVLAGYITRPLRLVQEQIGRISLGASNEKIRWQGTDELGRLITEYNQMLGKLEESALRLAQSERESAWREMAKQVAHEIKNPLTPMKLNLQYLQHLMKSDPADFREKFEKASAGIIEQIDSLANIANEFSHFAKLPVSQIQNINIVEVIRTSLFLFEDRSRITFRNRIPEEVIMVKADRDQCLRIFNNLFTNAVQALHDTADPWIEIGRKLSGDRVVILVRDNGCGIDEDLKPRIFTPNFTTKTTGSGLGLAMVKSIMEGLGGRISFTSEKGLGTIFYLEFIAGAKDDEVGSPS